VGLGKESGGGHTVGSLKANSGVMARVPAAGKVLEGDDQQIYVRYITIIPTLCCETELIGPVGDWVAGYWVMLFVRRYLRKYSRSDVETKWR